MHILYSILYVEQISPGAHLYCRLDIILEKGLSKHTLNTHFSGMKIDPKYAFLHAFFLICPSCPFQKFVTMTKNTPFFPILHIIAPLKMMYAHTLPGPEKQP